MDYRTFGLGSNTGDSSLIFTVEKTHLKFNSFFEYSVSEIVNSADTLGKRYYVYRDSVIVFENHVIPIRTSTIDSIEMYLQLKTGERSNSNFCVKSGAMHIIRIKSDHLKEQEFRLYNTFDSTALLITNLLMNYLPKNWGEFRPLDWWEIDKECDEWMKQRYVGSKKEVIPENRRDKIERTLRESLELKQDNK